MKVAQVSDDKIIVKQTEDIKLENKKGAIVRVLGCGLCGSDIVKFRHKIVSNGAVLGHEIVAQIIEINSATNFKIGDKIVTSLIIYLAVNVFIAGMEMFPCASILKKQIFFRGDLVKEFICQKSI